MAWEWSHTEEGLDRAYKNLSGLSKKELLVILREWQHHDDEEAGKDNPAFRLKFNGGKLPKDVLIDAVWERMESLRTCTNGGHEAYCCPDGCHTVAF